MNTKDEFNSWIAALRSGDYKQRRGSMYSSFDDSYCSLGVLGKVCCGAMDYVVLSSVLSCWRPIRLPSPVDIPAWIHKGEWDNLNCLCVRLNDDLGWSFNKIADWLDTEARPYVEEYIDRMAATQN